MTPTCFEEAHVYVYVVLALIKAPGEVMDVYVALHWPLSVVEVYGT